METLLEKVKANLILEHSADDALLESYIAAATNYAESWLPISMNRGTARRGAFSQTTRRRRSRRGTR